MHALLLMAVLMASPSQSAAPIDVPVFVPTVAQLRAEKAELESLRPREVRWCLVFGATWCPHCVAMHPDIETVRRAGWAIQYIDVDQHREYVSRIGVQSLPCIVISAEHGTAGAMILSREVGRKSATELIDHMRRWKVGRP